MVGFQLPRLVTDGYPSGKWTPVANPLRKPTAYSTVYITGFDMGLANPAKGRSNHSRNGLERNYESNSDSSMT